MTRIADCSDKSTRLRRVASLRAGVGMLKGCGISYNGMRNKLQWDVELVTLGCGKSTRLRRVASLRAGAATPLCPRRFFFHKKKPYKPFFSLPAEVVFFWRSCANTRREAKKGASALMGKEKKGAGVRAAVRRLCSAG